MSREKLTLTLVVLGTLVAAVILNDRPSAVASDPESEAAAATDAAANAADAAAIAADAAADAVAAAATPPAYTAPAYNPAASSYYAPSPYEDIHGSSACTSDCSGHDAGYAWAGENGIDDVDDCGGNSDSFIDGCVAYVEDNS